MIKSTKIILHNPFKNAAAYASTLIFDAYLINLNVFNQFKTKAEIIDVIIEIKNEIKNFN